MKNNLQTNNDLHRLLDEGLIAIKNKEFKPAEKVFEQIENSFNLDAEVYLFTPKSYTGTSSG